MSNTHDRVSSLARRFLDPVREPNFDASFSESAISSMDAMAFAKAVGSEFNCEIPADDFANFNCLRDLVSYLDANAS